MFENLIRPRIREDNNLMESEQRQMDFSREQTILNSSTHPEDDRTLLDYQENKSDLVRWQQELEPDMFELILSFQSLRRDQDDKLIPIKDEFGKPIPPLCNSLFIYQVVIPKLRPFMSKNLINSNFDERQINETQKNTADDIADMMADNWEKYGIDFVNFDGIIRDLKNVIKASCWRAFKGFTKKQDSGMTKRIESDMFGMQQKKESKGFAGMFGT